MSTLIENMQAVLAPLAAGGAWYAVNSVEPPVYPYIVFQRIISPTNNTLLGASDVQNTIIQIDIYSNLISEAATLAVTLASALAAAPFTAIQQSSQDLYEPDVKAHRVSSDWSCWSAN